MTHRNFGLTPIREPVQPLPGWFHYDVPMIECGGPKPQVRPARLTATPRSSARRPLPSAELSTFGYLIRAPRIAKFTDYAASRGIKVIIV